MRITVFAALAALACFAAPACARAACPALKTALTMQDAALPANADVQKLKGPAAQAYVEKLAAVVAKAATCMGTGSVDDQASALTTMSQVRYIQAWVLTHDGVAADRAKAVAIAKQSQKEIDAFTQHADLSGQATANLDNWSHWNDLMINHPEEACLGC